MHYLLTSRLERARTIHSAGNDGDLPLIAVILKSCKFSVAILSWPDTMAPW